MKNAFRSGQGRLLRLCTKLAAAPFRWYNRAMLRTEQEKADERPGLKLCRILCATSLSARHGAWVRCFYI
ncbi:MAG: hypothetical protein IJU95_04185 [Treponema sp.]|nr:hypothetical protein [Treponema sp.]